MRDRLVAVILAVAASSCESAPMPPPTSTQTPSAAPLAAHMVEHLQGAYALQAAIVDGRLMDARDRARWFADHPMTVPARDDTFLAQMRAAAVAVADAHDVPGMAQHLGELGHACAACHEHERATVALPSPAAPADASPALEAQMQRHTWAANRLWEAVFMPDPERWQTGARMLASATIDARALMHETPDPEVVGLAERLQAQATQASALTEAADQARFYGELLDTCARCHVRVRMTPVARDSSRR